MPGRNRQGPEERGPKTGRGLGRCGANAPKQAATQTEPAPTEDRVGTQGGDRPLLREQGRGQRLQRRHRAQGGSDTEQGRGRGQGGRGRGQGRCRDGQERGRGQGR